MSSVNILIAFYSRSGVTEALARGIAEGAESEGAEVRLRRAREIVGRDVMAHAAGWAENADRMNAAYEAPSEADAEWADGIVLGSPTRFGAVSSELKAYIDSLGGLWFQGKLNGKAGSAFTSTSTPHGGNESTTISLYNPMAHLGLIIVPLGYADPVDVPGRNALWGKRRLGPDRNAAECRRPRRGATTRAAAWRRSQRP